MRVPSDGSRASTAALTIPLTIALTATHTRRYQSDRLQTSHFPSDSSAMSPARLHLPRAQDLLALARPRIWVPARGGGEEADVLSDP